MSLIVKDSSEAKQFALPEPGLVRAVCVDAYDAGIDETPWGAKERIKLAWEIDEEHPEFGGPFRVNKKYTRSLNEKSNLSQDLESWRGKAFTDEERAGFDVEKLIGVPCMLNIVHNTDKQGRTWANVKAVLPMQRGLEPMKPSGNYQRVKDRPEDGHGNRQAANTQAPANSGDGFDPNNLDNFGAAQDTADLPF